MSETQPPLGIIWDRLLSRDAEIVRSEFSKLTADEQQAVLIHLRRMTKDPDWHPEQRLSAEVAIEALRQYL